MSGIRISAVVPTRNRCGDLEVCLGSLAAQNLPPDEYEIVVVDNGSTDGTREAIGRCIRAHQGRSIVCVGEPELGLGPARNAGIRASRGEIVAFIDDDASASPRWLASLLDVHARWNADIVGGRIVLDYSEERPAWLGGELEAWLSALDLGGEARPVRYPEQLFGANISFRRAWLDKTGGFDPALDRKGSSLASGGDTDLLWRMLRMGARAVYEPEAVVTHRIPAERLTRGWFVRRMYQGGRSNLMISVRHEGRLKAMRRSAFFAARVGRALARRPPRPFAVLLETAQLTGYLCATGRALFPLRALFEEWAAARRETARQARLYRPSEVEGMIAHRIDAELGGVRVLGWTRDGRTAKLFFGIAAPPRAPLLVFCHLHPKSCGMLPAEHRPHGFLNLDHRPALPARRWRSGRVFIDEVDLRDIPAGEYRLAFGLCDARTLARIPVRGTGADHLETGPFALG
ncbi:MAG: glycosyltransferase [Chlamydiae bacterium]|nr:glycosyltransferase [Chlamydiota bacterium]